MVDYDFSTLNDKEFEDITLELISRDRKKKYQRFKQGRDGGIDGISFIENNKEEVVQCKHLLKSGYSQLKSKIKKEEIAKVKKLSPSKYIFVTSVPLTKANVDEIFNLFTPYIKSKNDIYYQEKLNDILKDNKDIEEQNYKLWLNSTTVLSRIFNNAIKGRSQFLIEDINEKKDKYVLTKNHDKAIEKLEKYRVLILSGEPGIGKTTLADFISLDYIYDDFEFIVIENSLNEAEEVFNPEKKQLFYFDDFLGATYLEALNNKDSHIVNFMKRIIRDKNKRFILTTRTIIFNQALSLSDTFLSNNIENREYILKVKALSPYEKAQILYNHIYFSLLDKEFIDEIYKEKNYLKIIEHKNFNPRLIEFITCRERMAYTTKENYWSELFNKLKNPYDIWQQTFDKQSDEFIRLIVRLVVFNRNEIDENKLKKAYEEGIKVEKLINYSSSSKEFNSIIKNIVKYFLNRYYKDDGSISYTLFNPSIADYIINRYKNDEQKVILTFKSIANLSSLTVLCDLYKNKDIKKETYTKTLIELYNDIPFYSKEESIDYKIRVMSKLHESKIYEIDTSIKRNLLYKLIDKPNKFYYIDNFFELLKDSIKENSITLETYDFINPYISHCYDDLENLNAIIDFIKEFNLKNEENIFELEETISNYLASQLESKMDELSSSDVEIKDYSDFWGGDLELHTDLESEAENILVDLIYELETIEEIKINKSNLISNIDFYDIESRLLDEYKEDQDYWDYQSNSNNINRKNERSIDDLFRR